MFAQGGAKGLRQSARCFSSTATRPADFTHAVIGGGAVGLAIARRLQQRDGVSTVLIEKHGMVGSETSSRNSEVLSQLHDRNTSARVLMRKIRSFMLVSTIQRTALRLGYAYKARR